MARNNLGRLFSSISNPSVPKLALPYTRSESVIRSASNSASRLISSSTQQQQLQEEANQENLKKQQEEKGTMKTDFENENQGDDDEDGDYVNKETGEIGGPKGPEPTRFGDWERNGRCSDF